VQEQSSVRIKAADWLNGTARDALRPATAAAAAVSGALALLNPFLLPPEAVMPLTATAAGVALFNALIGILVRRRPLSADWAHPLGGAVAGSVLFANVVFLAYMPDPRQTTTLMLVAIAAGGCMASRRWLATVIGATLLVFASGALRSPTDPQWVHFGVALAFSFALAFLFHELRLRTLLRLRVSLDASEQELAERARVEAALRASEIRFRQIFEHAPLMMHSIDREGRLLEVNDKWLEETGYGRDEVLGRSITSVLAPESAEVMVRESLPRFWSEGVVRGVELRMLRRDRSSFDVEIDAAVVSDAAGSERSLTVLRNVSSRKHAQTERERLRQQLFEARKLESLGLLAGGIAHDFNNLLAAILGNAHLVLDALPAEHAQHAAVAEITAAAERGRLLTRQLLSYAGRAASVRVPVDLSEQVCEVATIMKRRLRPNVTLRFDLADSLAAVEVDPGQLQQVILNLLSNAADALGSEGGAIEVRTGLARLESAELAGLVAGAGLSAGLYVRLDIADDGCGMDAETRDRLFDPFFTSKEGGHGLGLPVALGVVRAHGGGIAVDSEPGGGTCFHVYLPASSRAPQAKVVAAPDDVRGRGRVLLADDDAAVRRVARRMLERLGYEVTEAVDGDTACECAREAPEPFAAALLDLRMPGGGVETARALRGIDAALPILLQSGFDADDAVAQSGLDGAIAFLPKPFAPHELGVALRALIAGSERKSTAAQVG
jgi:PAS domain S-box-containing protein